MASPACSSSWLRLVRILVQDATNVLKQFLLFSIHPETLEKTLTKNSSRLSQLKSKRVICDDNWEKLFPASGDPPNADKFDITLLNLLIREFSNLPTPANGWNKLPDETDDSIQANIATIKFLRNEVLHSSSTDISESEFEEKWNLISSSLERILLYIHKEKTLSLKNDPIDDNMRQILEDRIKEWQELNQQDNELIYDLSSRLPDQMSEESVYGRSNEIALVKDKVENEGIAVVLITGGPGFGKTTVARMAAQKLKENGQTVLFCSLQGKKTFDEVATEMILSCRKEPGQLPDSLEYWLKNWSKQISRQPTVLVLDNADGIIESEADRALYLETLSTMRRLSGNNLTFLITSRTRLQDVKSWKEVKINPLSNEDAKRVLNSCVNNEERKSQLQSSSHLDTIAKLCGCVPLALSIVGSLLSDYPGEVLIEHLEKEPMDILEGNSESFRKAIANSFALLNDAEQDALVALSVLPASFDFKAARAVFQDCPGSLPITTLRSLNIRSLLELVSSLRYKLHPLVRDFGKKIGQTKSPQVLQNSELLARVHFLSRLEENARMLYWEKDKCRESIESFGEDRHNYEFCLQNVADHEISSCEPFLNNFAQTCMYLEKCLAPNSYTQFLELLLTCKSFKSKTHPVLRVELLCVLGEEMRRTGKNIKYQEYMEEAHGLFSKHLDDFETRALSHVFYLHNRARFVSEKNKRYDLNRKSCMTKHWKSVKRRFPIILKRL